MPSRRAPADATASGTALHGLDAIGRCAVRAAEVDHRNPRAEDSANARKLAHPVLVRLRHEAAGQNGIDSGAARRRPAAVTRLECRTARSRSRSVGCRRRLPVVPGPLCGGDPHHDRLLARAPGIGPRAGPPPACHAPARGERRRPPAPPRRVVTDCAVPRCIGALPQRTHAGVAGLPSSPPPAMASERPASINPVPAPNRTVPRCTGLCRSHARRRGRVAVTAIVRRRRRSGRAAGPPEHCSGRSPASSLLTPTRTVPGCTGLCRCLRGPPPRLCHRCHIASSSRPDLRRLAWPARTPDLARASVCLL